MKEIMSIKIKGKTKDQNHFNSLKTQKLLKKNLEAIIKNKKKNKNLEKMLLKRDSQKKEIKENE